MIPRLPKARDPTVEESQEDPTSTVGSYLVRERQLNQNHVD